MASSQPRQNFHRDCEAGINKHINLELYARYVYQSMATHFDRDDVALRGFCKLFKEASEERNECAEKLIRYQNMRGGRVVLQPIGKPERDEWGTGLHAIQAALDLEKIANRSLLDLHIVAIGHTDPQMCDTLQSEHLEGKVEVIKKLADHITNLKRVGPGLGEFLFDKEALE